MLTSQVGARHGILGSDTEAIVAQRLFHDNLEDVINKTVSLQDDVTRYQNTLKYARSSLDYSVGKGLYMLPSDMLLKPLSQVIEGYNDKIVINKKSFELGKHYPVTYQKKTMSNKTISRVFQTMNSKPIKRAHTLDDHNDELQGIIFAIARLAVFAIWWIK